MPKKLNGYVKWIIIMIAVLTIAFNSGVTYNHIHELSQKVEKLTTTMEKMVVSINDIKIELAKRSNE